MSGLDRTISNESVESISEDIQLQNWSGSIPVVLTLSPTCVSSPTMPTPIHQLVPRHAYLHAALKETVLRLHQFAPITLKLGPQNMVTRRSEPKIGESSNEKAESDAATEQGEKATTNSKNSEEEQGYPICWFEDEDSKMALRWHLFAGVLYDLVVSNRSNPTNDVLPWRIRLHFGNYSSLLLPLESSTLVLSQVQFIFKNSLKQALCLLSGSNKAAMKINKETHGRLWEAVHRGHGSLYQQAIQDVTGSNSDGKNKYKNLPIRVLVNSRTPLQKQCPYDTEQTLGDLLDKWVLQPIEDTTSPSNTILSYSVAGICPPLETPLVDLWQSLAQPDLFLYIVVRVHA